DPRTRHHLFTTQGNDLRQPALKVLPEGESSSIRLGNPFGSKTQGGESPEGEAIAFNIAITEENALILFKWAAVLEISNHENSSLHQRFRPQQIVYFTDMDGKKLDSETDLKSDTYRFYFERYGVNDLGSVGWKKFTAHDADGKNRTAYWQDWTTTGFDMRNYIGQTVQLHVENFECAVEEQLTTTQGGVKSIITKYCGTEYGYIYFHISCHELNLIADCYEEDPSLHAYKISAPEGFTYKWKKNNQSWAAANDMREFLVRADGATKYTCQLIYNQGGGTYTEISVTPPFAHAYLKDTLCTNEKNAYNWNGYTFNMFKKDVSSQYYYVHDTVSCDTMTTMQLLVADTYNIPINKTILPNQLPYTWDGLVFDKEGAQEKHLTSVYGCDSTITYTLYVNKEVRTTDYVTRCSDELPFAWNGIQISSIADNGKTATLASSFGGDSIITLQLTIYQSYPQLTESATICERELPYRWNGYDLTQAGVYQLDLSTIHGCDSVITFTLNVQKAQDIEVSEQTCSNLLPFVWQTWRTNQLTETGTYHDTLRTPQGCDSIRYTLHLIVNPSTMQGNVTLAQDTLCADDDFLTLNYRHTSGQAQYINVIFDQSAHVVGFQDIPHLLLNGNERTVTLPIPNGADDKHYTRPDTYYGSVEVVNSCDETTNIPFQFTLLYPSWIILQRWNDVLALFNENYNGGYSFSDIHWYHNGMPIDGKGAHNSQIYTKDYGQETLDFGTEYWAELTRTSDGKTLRTCAVLPQYQNETIPVQPNAPQIIISPTVVSEGNRHIHIDTNISGQYSIYYSNGAELQKGYFGEAYGNEYIDLDASFTKGTYLVVFYGDEGTLDVKKLFVR
ncbi:MAG: hypothetical protein MJZ92_06035, partial [Paludibacteraceae bacterium]|nr:hypothetical protein [Paludibacteraceae bacterium]